MKTIIKIVSPRATTKYVAKGSTHYGQGLLLHDKTYDIANARRFPTAAHARGFINRDKYAVLGTDGCLNDAQIEVVELAY